MALRAVDWDHEDAETDEDDEGEEDGILNPDISLDRLALREDIVADGDGDHEDDDVHGLSKTIDTLSVLSADRDLR
jgi:hypothetical protein